MHHVRHPYPPNAPVLQFGDRPIMDYVTHQRRLYPALATAYALHLSMVGLKVRAVGTLLRHHGAQGREDP